MKQPHNTSLLGSDLVLHNLPVGNARTRAGRRTRETSVKASNQLTFGTN
jgi:hypothetical protein